MYTLHQAKFFVAIFLCIISLNTTHCMQINLECQPLISNEKQRMHRWQHKNDRILPGVTIIREATEQEQKGVCFNYAIQQITGCITTDLHNNVYCNLPLNPAKYFEQTYQPQENDLAIYVNEYTNEIQHFARVITNNLFESKWGSNKEILQHEPFNVPMMYGEIISFWTLKTEFTTTEGKQKLIQSIEQDIIKHSE